MTRRIYLDVDGVINAVSIRTPDWGWSTEAEVVCNRFEILYSPDLVEALNRVAALDGVEFFWLTTWEDDAPSLLAPMIGLDGRDWPVLGIEHRGELELGWWKLQAIREHLDGFDGQAMWIDDDIKFETGARDWLNDVADRVSWLSPATSVGITAAQMSHLEEWAQRDRERVR